MKKLDTAEFETLLEQAAVKPRLKRELRFVTSTAGLSDKSWQDSEFIAVTDRSGNKGVLIVQLDDAFYVLAYEGKRGITNSFGKAQPIICDFCRTWQTGSRSGSILFTIGRDTTSFGYLCCADLRCSDHVRSKTQAARTSRSQLREDLTDEQRVMRLQERLHQIIDRLGITPLYLQ